MGGTGAAGRRAGLAFTAIIAATGILAGGCGSAARPDRSASRTRISVADRTAVPPGGSPAEARAVGTRMLASLILPPGARRIGAQRQPQRGEVIGSDDLVDLSRFYRLPLSLSAASTFLQAHIPVGDTVSGTGSGNNGPGGTGYFMMVSYALKRPPVGIDQGTMLLATLAVGPHGGTIMRADAEVVWYPPRSAAEYINPSGYRSVTITVTLVNRQGRARTVTRTFGRPVIARLARVLNRLRTLAPPGPISCPAMNGTTFTARLTAASPRYPKVVISPAGCIGDLIKVAGKAQPVLLDFESQKIKAVIGPLLEPSR
jgi:hypothetical protein